jgi:hypothetical protein
VVISMSNLPRPDRRNLLKFGVAAAASVAAMPVAPAVAQDYRGRTMNLDGLGETGRAITVERRHNPILFWNDVALQLVALDHSVDARDARAPGPCATARALGLAHIVMADAVAAV